MQPSLREDTWKLNCDIKSYVTWKYFCFTVKFEKLDSLPISCNITVHLLDIPMKVGIVFYSYNVENPIFSLSYINLYNYSSEFRPLMEREIKAFVNKPTRFILFGDEFTLSQTQNKWQCVNLNKQSHYQMLNFILTLFYSAFFVFSTFKILF